MPIYEYRCDDCGHELDALQKINDDPLRDCPECSSAALRRLISAPVFRLKGAGWYETDFKSDKEKKRNLAGDAKPDGQKDPKPGDSAGSKSADVSGGKQSDSKSGSDKPKKSEARATSD